MAYTLGPGLQGSLHVGTSFAKSYAYALGIPSIPVHHMRAHVLAHMLKPDPTPDFPFFVLDRVQGAHPTRARRQSVHDGVGSYAGRRRGRGL